MNTPNFQAFDIQHLITLAIITAGCLLLAWKARTGQIRQTVGRLLGFLLLGYAVFFYVQQAAQNALTWEYSLPLELCNLVLIACIVALFWPSRFASEIAYFWGLGGVLQATLTPDLTRGFPSWDFTLFFWSHGAILMAIIFLAVGREFRPRHGSVLRMMIALNVYGLLVGTADAIAGWNYGYLCRKPGELSLLNYLGPWPWYLVSIELVALLIFLLVELPWLISDSLRKRDREQVNGG